jgi:hypothetical protein
MKNIERAAELFRDATQLIPGIRERLFQAIADHDPLIRLVAAIQIASRWPEELPETSVGEVLELLARDEYFEQFPFQEEYTAATTTEETCGLLGQDIVGAFAHLKCGQADFVIPRLLEFWSFDSQFYELGHIMLSLAFPSSDRVVVITELSGLQRRILQALIAQPNIWINDMMWSQALIQHGLPCTRSEMIRLLGYS